MIKIKFKGDAVLAAIAGISICLALSFGIYVGCKVTAANKDVEIMDLQARVETANGSLAEANVELAQYEKSKERMIAWSGLASFYADAHHGKRTASGYRFDMNAFTAAHRTLPFGSLVLVLDTRRFTWTLVEINDRGPAEWTERDIDLSRAAARQLGMERDGVIPALMLTVQGRPSTQD
jgi:rare lipoprotein A (peptidoglycan hydrolase)